jgi:hypothetical protein
MGGLDGVGGENKVSCSGGGETMVMDKLGKEEDQGRLV